jgi:hypothetical protein
MKSPDLPRRASARAAAKLARFCYVWNWAPPPGRLAGMQVESSAIDDIRYEGRRQKLYVRFRRGDEYVYVGVPDEVHRSFLEAPSKGRFFAYEIRDKYPYNRLSA